MLAYHAHCFMNRSRTVKNLLSVRGLTTCIMYSVLQGPYENAMRHWCYWILVSYTVESKLLTVLVISLIWWKSMAWIHEYCGSITNQRRSNRSFFTVLLTTLCDNLCSVPICDINFASQRVSDYGAICESKIATQVVSLEISLATPQNGV